tara:strand:- start:446 stop:1093 length:648 start_codon:yes stop_codon:yes gene_type:complete
MDEKIIQAQYDITKKTKLKYFYEKNKILIFSLIGVFIISFCSFFIYLSMKEKERLSASNSFVDARIYIQEGKKERAKNILKEIIYSEHSSYSALSLFVILNQKLITDENELSNLFDYILENHKFDKEITNLLIYKKALIQSNFVDESQLIDTLKPMINSESLWKPHALLLLADYFYSKNEVIKAKDFYSQVISSKNVQKDLFDHANSQLIIISNE